MKIRCSALGDIMTNPRSKSEEISKTALNKLIEIYIEERYDRSNEIFSKYLEKGIAVEEQSITLLSQFDGRFYAKNEDNIQNDWLTGTPDIITDEVIDIKSSWDIFTFHRAKNADIDKSYYYQLMGYMDLTGLEKARLVYCLVDTPNHLIESEKSRLAYKTGVDDRNELQKLEKQTEKMMRYSDIPIKERIHIFEIKRDNEVIDSIHERVELCRKIYNQLKEQ